jgi:hypothetical protein
MLKNDFIIANANKLSKLIVKQKIMKIFSILLLSILTLIYSCNPKQDENKEEYENILKVPSVFPTIAKAVESSGNGDLILVAPGKYIENNIEINKKITISSEWKLTADISHIDETIIDSEDKILFTIVADGVEISGLMLINGNHTLDISSNVTIMHNHFINNLDGMSFESGGGGYVGYNYAINDRDDALDLDIVNDGEESGSDILVEHNTFINCNDDGIEIRLFTYPDQNIRYTIRNNVITGSNNAGIQLISYDLFTGKSFYIHNNIISGCKTGLGCMEGSNTSEDLSGASKMDELVCFYNNTVTGNKMGATGGNRVIAMNNVIANNEIGGFKRFGPSSAILNNLFFHNGDDDFVDLNDKVVKEGNIFSHDPLLDEISFIPASTSPCIDAGLKTYQFNGETLIEIPAESIIGSAPDIGACEYGQVKGFAYSGSRLLANAGEEIVFHMDGKKLLLKGTVVNNAELEIKSRWKLVSGPGLADISDPGKAETEVKLAKEGIYEFSFTCWSDDVSSTDMVKVRYISGGDGLKLFLTENPVNILDAKDFAYYYGSAEILKDKDKPESITVRVDGKDDSPGMLEYSLGTSEDREYVIWLHIKCDVVSDNSLKIILNNKDMDLPAIETTAGWQWVKTGDDTNLAAGQWPLLIIIEKGSALIDKIIFTSDPGFIPGL